MTVSKAATPVAIKEDADSDDDDGNGFAGDILACARDTKAWFGGCARTMFGIDVRSLAAFRMCIGLVVGLDTVLLRMADVCAHYSDQGVLPTHTAREHLLGAGTQFSLLFINGSCKFAAAFFLFTFAVSMMLVVGYHTRLSGFLTWICCVSIHVRNLNVLNGGDHIIRLLLFFMFLCPGLGDAWSVDSLLENGRRMVLNPPTDDEAPAASAAAAAAATTGSAASSTAAPASKLIKLRPTHASVYPKRYGGTPHAGEDSDQSTVKVSPATFALLAQLSGCYFQTGWNKLYRKGGKEWSFDNLSAVHFSLTIHKWKKWPMADVLLAADRDYSSHLQWIVDMIGGSNITRSNNPEAGIAVTQLLTAFTLVLEIGAPLLFFWPLFPRRFLALTRYAAILCFLKLQFGLLVTLKLGIFPWIMTTALWPFVPSSFWNPKGGKGLVATLFHTIILWTAYTVWWINSFIFEDGEGEGTSPGVRSSTKALKSYREMTTAHWDVLFKLETNGVVYVLPGEDDKDAANLALTAPSLSAKEKRQVKKGSSSSSSSSSSSTATTTAATPSVSGRTKVRRYAKRIGPMCRDLFTTCMVIWSAMLFANAGFGWKCQNSFDWVSPTVGKWANKTCKSDMQWTFQISQGWKMFDRGVDNYDQWITMPAQMGDGRMGIDIMTAWPMLPDKKTRLTEVPEIVKNVYYPDADDYNFAIKSKEDKKFLYPYRRGSLNPKLNPLLDRRPTDDEHRLRHPYGNEVDWSWGWNWFWRTVRGEKGSPLREGGIGGLAFMGRHRWLMYTGHITSVNEPQKTHVLTKFGIYICKKWNIGRKYNDQVHAFSIISIQERTKIVRGGDNATQPDSIKESAQKPYVVWRHACFDVPVPPKWQKRAGPWQPSLSPYVNDTRGSSSNTNKNNKKSGGISSGKKEGGTSGSSVNTNNAGANSDANDQGLNSGASTSGGGGDNAGNADGAGVGGSSSKDEL